MAGHRFEHFQLLSDIQKSLLSAVALHFLGQLRGIAQFRCLAAELACLARQSGAKEGGLRRRFS